VTYVVDGNERAKAEILIDIQLYIRKKRILCGEINIVYTPTQYTQVRFPLERDHK